MQLETFTFNTSKGWSVANFPALDSEQTLVIIFAAPDFLDDPKPIHEITKFYSKSCIIGCSTAGEIYDTRIFDLSISVAVIKFTTTKIKLVKAEVNSIADSAVAGHRIFKELDATDLKGIFVLSKGLNINGSELVEGLDESNNNIKITGGLAGDGKRFEKTWVIYKGEILTNHVVAVGFYGDKIRIGHASKGGWDIFGPQRLITSSEGNILYELDDKPALTLYKTYLGIRAAELPASGLLYPLEIRKDKNDPQPVVRTILAVDEEKQSVTFAGDMPQGYYAQLMHANFDRLISSAGETGEIASQLMFKTQHSTSGEVLCIAISCVGRRLILGERTEEELEALKETLPNDARIVGFYSYGELSPFATGTCQLHNQTMTITTFYEDS
jgi:hypothetical protein